MEIKMPNIKKRRFNQAFGSFTNEPEKGISNNQKPFMIFKTT
jgi:hypothetical protein